MPLDRVIAIDGPSAAGKGTLARRLARHFGFAYLDTGALYRAVALRLIAAGAAPDRDPDPAAAEAAARQVRPEELDDPALRTDETAGLASKVAALPGVRAALRAFQRDFAAHPPAPYRGAVLDGRDIGSVVCPDARVKLFVTASAEVRAERRLGELLARGAPVIRERVLADLLDRDARDSARAISPMKPAADALPLDTTDLNADEAFEAARALIGPVFDRA